MTISRVFGLPAHPLFVHVPVVLIPLVGIGAIAMALSARVRDQFGWLVLAVGVVAGISTQFAIESGQALRHRVPQSAELTRHAHIAESIRPLILLLFLVALAVMLLDRRTRGAWPFSGGTATTARFDRPGLPDRRDRRGGGRHERASFPDRRQRRQGDLAAGPPGAGTPVTRAVAARTAGFLAKFLPCSQPALRRLPDNGRYADPLLELARTRALRLRDAGLRKISVTTRVLVVGSVAAAGSVRLDGGVGPARALQSRPDCHAEHPAPAQNKRTGRDGAGDRPRLHRPPSPMTTVAAIR